MESDTTFTLADIKKTSQVSIVSGLLNLQEHAIPSSTSAEWVESLKCLKPEQPSRKRKRNEHVSNQRRLILSRIDPIRTRNYIAVSYTWKAPPHIQSSTGSYLIKSKIDATEYLSSVRDSVLDRVIAYMDSIVGVSGFWVDQECIDQGDPKEKALAINSMESVYRLSEFPVGLLSVCIESKDELYTLKCILDERTRSRPRVAKVFQLLDKIVSDPWWERVWTFQEDYCTSYKMDLLIPYSTSLKRLGKSRCFGRLKNDLCVKSCLFRTKATKLAKYYENDPRYKAQCTKILERSGQYNVQLREKDTAGNLTINMPMSPVIFSNVTGRKATIPSDRLAVIANCCGYKTRFDTRQLDRNRESLSLAMLAMYLLNGEILVNGEIPVNGDSHMSTGLKSTIADFLGSHALSTIRPPDISQRLTFLKGLRLSEVHLTREGIETSGHLWKLGQIVTEVRPCGPETRSPSLNDLAHHLANGESGRRYTTMAGKVQDFIEEVDGSGSDVPTFAQEYKRLMSDEVVHAMERPGSLRLACIVLKNKSSPKTISRKEKYTPYCGIFIEERVPWTENETYVFTSMTAGKTTADDRYVSLEVEILDWETNKEPRLAVKRWINGLIFYSLKENPKRKFIFPWPKSISG